LKRRLYDGEVVVERFAGVQNLKRRMARLPLRKR